LYALKKKGKEVFLYDLLYRAHSFLINFVIYLRRKTIKLAIENRIKELSTAMNPNLGPC